MEGKYCSPPTVVAREKCASCGIFIIAMLVNRVHNN